MAHKPIHIIVVAAGTGSRFGSAIPKQFCMLAGRPVVMHAIDRLRSSIPEAKISLVISREMEGFWQELCREHSFVSPHIVYGGATRWESVRNALTAPGSPTDGITMVHDGARPLVSHEVMKRMIEYMDADDAPDGAVTAIGVINSLRQVTPDGSSRAVNRSEYRAIQTPQAFRTELLRRAYDLEYRPEFTDDASVMEFAGYDKIAIVEGAEETFKITRPLDIEIAELYLRRLNR